MRKTFFFTAAGIAVLAASPARASYRDFVARAHQALEDSQEASRAAPATCQKAVLEKLDAALGHVSELHRAQSSARVEKASAEVTNIGIAAVLAGCPNAVSDPIREAGELLDQAKQLRAHEPSGSSGPLAAPAADAAMSDADFKKLLQSVRGTKDEVAKGESVKNAVGAVFLTSEQLGSLLDEMGSDFIKLDVLNVVAPKVSDPQNGGALVKHFDSPDIAQEATSALDAQSRRRLVAGTSQSH